MEKNKYDWLFWTEWISTAVLMVGVALNAVNIYPLNVYLCLIGNFGWAVVALRWRSWSLLVIQAVTSLIYLIGLVLYYSK